MSFSQWNTIINLIHPNVTLSCPRNELTFGTAFHCKTRLRKINSPILISVAEALSCPGIEQ